MRIRRALIVGALVGCCGAVAVTTGAQAPDESVRRAVAGLRQVAGSGLHVRYSPETGRARFVSARRGGSLAVSRGATPAARAQSFLRQHGAAFGLKDVSQLRAVRSRKDAVAGMDHVRFRQEVNGVPVVGAELFVHLRDERVLAANGRLLPEAAWVDTTASVPAEEAEARARELAAQRLEMDHPTVSEPRLEIVSRAIFDGRRHPTHLAWFLDLRLGVRRHLVWVSARTGNVVLHFEQTSADRSRSIYTADGTNVLPGELIRIETGPPTGNADADAAFNYTGDTYDFYHDVLGRDSYDNAGAALVSTVHYCWEWGCPMANAYWDSDLRQMVFGEGFSRADDVVAHELTHAVTEYSAGLFYYMQSGALNESFSDIFGETVDQWNGAGTDTAAVRWLSGEDVPGLGAGRNMMNPNAFGDPGRVSDPLFLCADARVEDLGGVHSNSGVPNHAYALMVDGGAYNGVTVTGIGLEKAARVQYRALTEYLGSASDFLDDYEAVQQACSDLVDSNGITTEDCEQIHKALDAVELASPWPCSPGQGTIPELCPAGQVPANLFYDDLEIGSNWTTTAWVGWAYWTLASDFSTSGSQAAWSDYAGATSDRTLEMASSVAIPSGGARLQFNHAFGFDNGSVVDGSYIPSRYWDGGVIEVSRDGGTTWNDGSYQFTGGAWYNGTIDSSTGNPLGGRSAFIGDSWGYTATQIDLHSLAGTSVRFRFRVGEDSSGADQGWFIDDVRIYQCVDGSAPTVSVDSVSIREGDSGSAEALFTARLSAPTGANVTVNYATGDVSAAAGVDYTGTSGTITIPAGATIGMIAIEVVGDTDEEGDETFSLTLSGATNATVVGGPGIGTIQDDEGLPAPPATSSWALARRGMTHNMAITYGNSLYVAAGYFGLVYTSPDGVTWTEHGTPTRKLINGLAYGNGRFVAVTGLCTSEPAQCAAQPVSLTSTDGSTWAAFDVSAAAGSDLRAVAFSPTLGGGTFMAVGENGTILTSTNGETWTARTSGTTVQLNGVAFGAGQFVAVGAETLLTSSDGVAWSPLTSPRHWWGTLNAVTFTGTQFVAAGWLGLFTSPDGTTWTDRWNNAYPNGLYGVASGGGTIVVVSCWTGNALLTSTDGATWTRRTLATGVGTGQPNLAAVAYGSAGFVGVGWYGDVHTSPTGVTWTRRTSPSSPSLWGLAYDGARFCAVGTFGAVSSSTDGVSWTNRTGLAPRNGTYDSWYALAHGSGKFVAVGSSIMTSPDCVTWIDRNPQRTLPKGLPGSYPSMTYYDIVRGDGLFVAVGSKGGTDPRLPMLATSPDGVTWTQRDPGFPAGVELSAVGFGAGRYVVAGLQSVTSDWPGLEPFLATSADGITWTESPAPFANRERITGFSFRDGQFVATGRSLWISPDGINWAAALDADDWWGGVAHGSSRIVAVGQTAVHESSDGDRWEPQTVPSAHAHTAVAYSPSLDRFVAIGEASIIYTNNPVPTISVADVAMAEGDAAGTLAFPVTLSAARGVPVTVHYATANQTALAGSDYTAASGTLSFAPGETSSTIDVPVSGDLAYEAAETLRVTLSAPAGATLSDALAVGTLTNDDPAPVVSIDSISIREGNTGVFTVTLAGATTLPATVRYAAGAGTAVAPADFRAVSGVLTFAVGTTSRTINVPTVGDALAEGETETFDVTLSSPSHCSIDVEVGVGTIVDNDSGGQVQFGAASYTVKEGIATVLVNVTRTGGAAAGVTVAYATSDGTATAGSDYTSLAGTLTFGAGVVTLPIRVPIKNDTLAEGSEAFSLTISSPTGGASLGTPATATLTILDDDLGGTLQFSAASYTVTEAGPTALITVTRTGGAAAGATVDYATSDGTATAGSDYSTVGATLTFGAGVTSQTFTVPILNDTEAEGDETVDLTLASPGGGALLGARSTASLKIADNEPGVQLSAATYTVSEAGPTATVTVRRLGGPGAFTVSYALPAGGSATATDDYGNVSGTLSFGAAVAARTFAVPIVNDTVPEGNETVHLALISPSGAFLGPQSTAVLTIVDNEASVQFSSTAYTISEAGPAATITVQRTGPATRPATVTYSTSDGATSGATAGSDYTAATGTLSFAPGAVSRTFTVPINNDSDPEGNETIALSLSAPILAFVGPRGTAALTIVDNEPGVQLSAATYTVAESGPVATITARRVGGPAAFTVGWATQAGGSATAGADYTAASGVLTFGAGVASRTFTVAVANDTEVETSETVNLALENPVGAFLAPTLTSATLTITDNDLGGTIAFESAVVNGGEGAGTAIVGVKRTGSTAGSVTVDYATADGTATAGSDYTQVTGTLTFAAGEASRSFGVELLQDADGEGDETISLALSNVTGPARLGTPAAAMLVVIDDDDD